MAGLLDWLHCRCSCPKRMSHYRDAYLLPELAYRICADVLMRSTLVHDMLKIVKEVRLKYETEGL